MRFLSCLRGWIGIRITGADPGTTLEKIRRMGIALEDIRWEDALTVRFRCAREHRHTIHRICRKQGDEMGCFEEAGLIPSIKHVLKRPVLTAGALMLFILTLFLPTRVLFVSVDGNSTVEERRILEAAEECGIRFGASRRQVRSEKMKNRLLEKVPELKWAGVNTSGCTAVISVREQPVQEQLTGYTGVSSIVAACDGRITSCTVTKGNGLCAPGQVVQKGQLLISGYLDCGICIRVTGAEGEIYAETRQEKQAVSPMQHLRFQENTDVKRRFSLILGKKRINFWKDSGISPVTCGRMYEEYYITLPGGFRLPVCLTVETLTDREVMAADIPPENMESGMKAFLRASVAESSVACSILREDQKLMEENGCYVLEGVFFCSEMIGRVITEEIGETNGKTD